MGKILKENGNLWQIEEFETYGVKHIKKIFIGTYDEKPVEKPKKIKKSEE